MTKKTKSRSIMIGGMLLAIIFSSVFSYANLYRKRLVEIVHADDDEEDEDEDDEEDNNTKIEYRTVYTKLPDTIVTTIKQVPRYDSDKDGMYDDEDPHPGVNEFLIVKDANLNGIDDRYEQ